MLVNNEGNDSRRVSVFLLEKVSADRGVWDWMLEKYKSEQNAQEKLKLLQGLASAESEEILKHLLELAKNEDVVRSQDYFTLLTFMCGETPTMP